MSSVYRQRKSGSKKMNKNVAENKNNFRNQDGMSHLERRKAPLNDTTIYLLARHLMGNEVQILTNSSRIEGVLKGFDSTCLCLTKVMVFSNNESNNVKESTDFKDVSIRDINMVKRININGKTGSESVLIDSEISSKKSLSKNLDEDKNLVPYFNDDDHKTGDDEDLTPQSCGSKDGWYPEEMLKVNKEKFQLETTFSENMEEYTTQIDTNDPDLEIKVERAKRLAREIENDSGSRKLQHLEDDDTIDEEHRFGAANPILASPAVCDSKSSVVSNTGNTNSRKAPSDSITTVPHVSLSDSIVPPPSSTPSATLSQQSTTPSTTTTTSTKLNPNAKEFRPKAPITTTPNQTQPLQNIYHTNQPDDNLIHSVTSAAVTGNSFSYFQTPHLMTASNNQTGPNLQTALQPPTVTVGAHHPQHHPVVTANHQMQSNQQQLDQLNQINPFVVLQQPQPSHQSQQTTQINTQAVQYGLGIQSGQIPQPTPLQNQQQPSQVPTANRQMPNQTQQNIVPQMPLQYPNQSHMQLPTVPQNAQIRPTNSVPLYFSYYLQQPGTPAYVTQQPAAQLHHHHHVPSVPTPQQPGTHPQNPSHITHQQSIQAAILAQSASNPAAIYQQNPQQSAAVQQHNQQFYPYYYSTNAAQQMLNQAQSQHSALQQASGGLAQQSQTDPQAAQIKSQDFQQSVSSAPSFNQVMQYQLNNLSHQFSGVSMTGHTPSYYHHAAGNPPVHTVVTTAGPQQLQYIFQQQQHQHVPQIGVGTPNSVSTSYHALPQQPSQNTGFSTTPPTPTAPLSQPQNVIVSTTTTSNSNNNNSGLNRQ